MPEVAKSILLILTALLPIVNPLEGSPVFLALTQEYPTAARRLLARHGRHLSQRFLSIDSAAHGGEKINQRGSL